MRALGPGAINRFTSILAGDREECQWVGRVGRDVAGLEAVPFQSLRETAFFSKL
jgi:hypothetical protein